MKKRGLRWFTSVVAFAALLLMTLAAVSQAAEPASVVVRAVAQPRLAPPNPEFVLWQAMRGLEPVLDAAAPHGLGERPGPQPALSDTAVTGAPELLGYDASFDLRTQGKLTAVKNQGSWGTCWSFATYGALESALMPGESADYSEDNLVLNSGFDTGSTASLKYNHGGNLTMSTAYLTRWAGPVNESEDTYGDSSTPAGLSARKHVQDVSWYAPRKDSADNDRIKYALTTCGAVYASMSWQGSTSSTSAYYNATTHAYYLSDAVTSNHAVLIVGWDDDYPAGNFSTTPADNGAFIVRNSWGSGWGESGFFYVSYDDAVLGRASNCATFDGVQPTGNYGDIYQYDPLGYTAAIGYSGGTSWGANKFTTTSAQMLNAVGFYALRADTAYEVWAGPSTSTLSRIASGTLTQAGFHTVPVPAGTAFASGATFVIAVKITSPGLNGSLALEYPSSGYASPTAATGQSYMSSNGTSWSDVAVSYPNTNFCLKAYASTVPTSTSSYGFAADATSAWKTSSQSVTVTASGGDGTGRTIFYSLDGGTSWNSTVGDTATFTVSGQGAHRIKYYARTSLASEAVHDAGYVNVDSAAPTTADDHLTASLAAPATITLTPSDATSGMTGGAAKTEYKVDGAASYTTGTSVSLATPGSHTVVYRSTDRAGNTEAPDRSFTVQVTSPAPVSASTYDFASWVDQWKTSVQTATITAAGGEGTGLSIRYSTNGGIDWTTVPGGTASVTVADDGVHHVQYYAYDSLATEPVHDAGYVNIDTTAPITTDDHESVPLWAPAVVTLTPTDVLSGMSGGLAATEYKVDGAGSYTIGTSVVLTAGTHSVAYRSRDRAGNVEGPDKTFTVTVLQPTVPASVSAYSFASIPTAGWKNTPQTVTITAAGGSGEAMSIFYSLDGGASWTGSGGPTLSAHVSDQGQHHFQYYARDTLATESVHDAGWINIDSVRPTTAAAAASVRRGRRVTLKFRVNDAVPGCGTATVKLQIKKLKKVVKTIHLSARATNTPLTYKYAARLPKGKYTWRVLATDAAGNVATRIVAAKLVIK